MKVMEIKKIRKAMEKSLDSKRYEHTLGVEYTAAALAMRYGASIKNAQIAGLLHDCAKCISDEKRISICEKHHMPISEVERRNPSLLHPKAGSIIAAEEYGVTDPDVIHAILNHTTGRPEMSLLEKIVFVADYIEPGRSTAPGLDEIRPLAFIDLNKALVRILQDTLKYLEQKNAEIDPMTLTTLQFYAPKV